MSAISQAMRDICSEKGIPYESVLETVEVALAAAYRKDYGEKNQNIKAVFNPETAEVQAFDEKEVVEDAFVADALKEIEERAKQRELEEELRAKGELPPAPPTPPSHSPHGRRGEQDDDEVVIGEDGVKKYNPKLHLALAESLQHKPDAKVGDIIRIPLPIHENFGRMAAQTAKQVIMQRLREAERDTIFNEWKGQEGQVVPAVVQRREGRTVLLDLGPRATGILREEEQIPTDRYATGTRLKVFLATVGKSLRGPELLCSRTHPDLLKYLFSVEVPEVASGAVELMGIAREPGSRAKVAVRATEENVDPIGACIGQRGTRVQTIIAELSGEKIDIIEYQEDPKAFIASAMAPAKAAAVELHEGSHTAIVRVPAEQFSLAIGRGGQNVRLAARLTGWKISVQDAAGKAEQSGTMQNGERKNGEPAAAENQEQKNGESKGMENPEPIDGEQKDGEPEGAEKEGQKDEGSSSSVSPQ